MPAVVEVASLLKTYGEGTSNPVHALRGVSFTVQARDFVALMGHSGSGKSTLMNLLGCLDRPTSGTYRLNGMDVSGKSRRELARVRAATLGFVFQNYQLLPRLTVLENCELPLVYLGGMNRAGRRARATEALARVGLSEKLQRRPAELSGGQQQRVAIARALVNRPALLLADEPTGNLDTRTGLEIMSLLQEFNGSGLTIVLVTHEADVAACARRVLYLRDGRLVNVIEHERPADAKAALAALPADDAAALVSCNRNALN